jgi:hypothetical protein
MSAVFSVAIAILILVGVLVYVVRKAGPIVGRLEADLSRIGDLMIGDRAAPAPDVARRDERVAYWSRMLDSVQSLQAGVPSAAFSRPDDPARAVEVAPGVTIHDAHTCLAMIVSGRYGPEGVARLVKATGYPDGVQLEASLLAAVERQLVEASR